MTGNNLVGPKPLTKPVSPLVDMINTRGPGTATGGRAWSVIT